MENHPSQNWKQNSKTVVVLMTLMHSAVVKVNRILLKMWNFWDYSAFFRKTLN